MAGRPVNATWAGYIGTTPDGVRGIGEIASVPGGADPIVDPRPYHPDRFAHSSWGKVADF